MPNKSVANSLPQETKSRNLMIGLLAVLFAFVTLASWGISSPLGSSPDDTFHLASVWCGDGVRDGICEQTDKPEVLSIPTQVYESANCFAYQPESSAGCQHLDTNTTGAHRSDIFDFNNSDHLYPPVFYAVTSSLVDPNPVASIWRIRLVNSAIAVGLFGLLFLLLPKTIRHLPIWAFTATAVPLTLFIIPSNNPSSWAVTGAGLLLFSLIGYYKSEGRRRWALAAMSVISTVLMAGARADAAIYVGITLVASLILVAKKSDLALRRLWLPIFITLIAIGFFFTANQVGLAAGGLDGGADLSLSKPQLLFLNILMMPLLWLGIFGTTGLGWLDTQMPVAAWVSSAAGFVLLVVFGLNRLTKRTWIAGLLVLAALWAIPTYILFKSHALVGALVQPRYMLPLIIVLTGIAVYRVAGKKVNKISRSLILVALVLLASANALSLHRNLKRYVTGIDVTGWNLDANPEWWWQIPLSPMTVWIIGSVSFAAFLAILYKTDPQTGFGISMKKNSRQKLE